MLKTTTKILGRFLYIFLVAVVAWLSVRLVTSSSANQHRKNDYAELNDVQYGLLSVDVWKSQLTGILASEIDALEISQTNQKDLRKHIENVLSKMIDQVSAKIKQENLKTAKGRFKQSFISAFVNIDDIKKGIPQYAESVVQEINRSKTKKQIKSLLTTQLTQYSAETKDLQDRSELNRILQSLDAPTVDAAKEKLNQTIEKTQKVIIRDACLLILIAVLVFVIIGTRKLPLTPIRYLALIAILLSLLATGVTTPMIDLEAKISHMSFLLLGHTVQFENQVLYFQSKSILNVFWIMATHPAIQMKFVGALVIMFSIFFPVFKLISSMLYFFNYKGAQDNKWVRFFVLKSGKWSLVDVLVVAIFMAYIGFSSIIDTQLSHLGGTSQDLVLLTTNGTSLQPGYYLFLAYAILSFALTDFVATPIEAKKSPIQNQVT